MSMNSKDWSALWLPLVVELGKAIIGLIFGKTETKTRIVNLYKGGYSNERHNNMSADNDNSSSAGFCFAKDQSYYGLP